MRAESRSSDHEFTTRPFGRVVVSCFVIVVIVSITISNLPPSAAKRAAYPIVKPFLHVTGLTQLWNLFAPNPPRSTRVLEATIEYDDGHVVRWKTPRRNPFIGVYTAARWRKLTGYALNEGGAHVRAGIAEWLASTHVRGGRRPEKIELFRAYYRAYAPGSGERGQPPWKRTLIYTWRRP